MSDHMNEMELDEEALEAAWDTLPQGSTLISRKAFRCAIRAYLSSLPSSPVSEPVAQFRKAGCSDWYDGFPDHEDGRGPYEERTLYLDPPPTAAQEAGK